MHQWTDDTAPQDFDQDLADTYVGQYILVGVTYLDYFGKLLGEVQVHGVIEAASEDGLEISLRGARQGERWIMPPCLDSIAPAAPGTYRLCSTGEVIEDPDLLSAWTLARPLEH
jgi:hypothetical protein